LKAVVAMRYFLEILTIVLAIVLFEISGVALAASNKEIGFSGNSHNPLANNSIRAFNPIANTREYLWLTGPDDGELQNRDNYPSSYVARLAQVTAKPPLASAPPTDSSPTSPPLVAGWLKIPLRTWVSRPYPLAGQTNHPQQIGETGYGPSPFGAGAKHQRLVWNPVNKRLYFYSGDFGGGQFGFQSSFKSDM